jgi:hypothetical protein
MDYQKDSCNKTHLMGKKMFDEFFKFKFWLKTSKNEHLWHYTRVNSAMDYQKDSYNRTHLMGKKLRGWRSISHIEKSLIP